MLSFGSAIMAPEVYLKALAMARNVAHQEGRAIRDFTTAVFDLVPIQGDIHKELPKTDPGYYFRPHKTILVRTVADGGESFYFCGDHRATFPALRRALLEAVMTTARDSGRDSQALRAGGGRYLPGPLVHVRPGDCGAIARDRHPAHRRGAHRSNAGRRRHGGQQSGGARRRPRGRAGRDRRRRLRLRSFRARWPSAASPPICACGPSELQTFTYTKVINGDTGVEDQPRARLHQHAAAARAIVERAGARATSRRPSESFDVILIADQAETSQGGVVTAAVRETDRRTGAASSGENLLRGFARAHPAFPQRDREAQSAGSAKRPAANCSGSVDYPALRAHSRLALMYRHAWRPKACWLVDAAGETWVRTQTVEQSGRHLRRGRQFLGRRVAGAGRRSVAGGGGASSAIWWRPSPS